MSANKLNGFWALFIILLVIIIVVGGIFIWSRYRPSQPVEIFVPPPQKVVGRIYIGGAVVTPGFYSFTSNESFETLIKAAGGVTGSVDLSGLILYVPEVGKVEPQKIDINRAEVWLLQALPEIGEVLAKRIVDYRQQNGPFQNIRDVTKVAGIGTTTYEKIKHLITVAD